MIIYEFRNLIFVFFEKKIKLIFRKINYILCLNFKLKKIFFNSLNICDKGIEFIVSFLVFMLII